MDEEVGDDYGPICNLPDEIILIILSNTDPKETVRFGSTCKRFSNLVNNDQHLWKKKFKTSMPIEIYKIVEEHSDGNWFKEIKHFYTLKRSIITELYAMSTQYFWCQTDASLEDVRNFFGIALASTVSYYYTMLVLQNIIKLGVKYVDEGKCVKPYTLTEVHYAKVALRHLIHAFMSMKWVKGLKTELLPETVLNFFLQWVDTDTFHTDEQMEAKFMEDVLRVASVLEASHPPSKENIFQRCAKGEICERTVLNALQQVMYKQRHMAVTHGSNLDTLNIVKVLENRCGSVISVAVIYQGIARRFGVTCELVAFPNHLFLEWRDKNAFRCSQLYTIDLATGDLHPKRQCPFAQNNQNVNYAYSPEAFLQYIYASFHMTMGAIKNWNTQNSIHLLDFLGIYDSEHNPYRYFLPFLMDRTILPAMCSELDIKFLSDDQLRLLSSLANLNGRQRKLRRKPVVKRHDGKVKFAVGMICYHRKYDYVCILRGWDVTCEADMEWQRRGTLDFGPTQPFYNVIAADQSERYVAQENLTEVAHPTRLYHLEDLIGREFTHFDGFAYVPNNEKRAEYPEEDPIINVFRAKCQIRPALASVAARAHHRL